MPYQISDPETIVQNLRDAGCSDAFIAKFMKTWEEGRVEDLLRLLCRQRCVLLECVHAEQKKLDCLDYLRYQLQKHDCEKNPPGVK